jgi:hypothetical protein
MLLQVAFRDIRQLTDFRNRGQLEWCPVTHKPADTGEASGSYSDESAILTAPPDEQRARSGQEEAGAGSPFNSTC